MKNIKRTISPLAASRAKSAGAAGEARLAGLDDIISELEEMRNNSVRGPYPAVHMPLQPMQTVPGETSMY